MAQAGPEAEVKVIRRGHLTFDEALKQLMTLEKKLRLEMQHNLRDLKLHMTQNKIDLVIRKANKLYQIRSQLGASKTLFKQEKLVSLNQLTLAFLPTTTTCSRS